MTSFLSNSYPKPKLIETKLLKKIINEQNNNITFEKKTIYDIQNYLKDIILNNWKNIIGILFISILFYWRYTEVKKLRKKNNKDYDENLEEDSIIITTESEDE